MHPRLHDLNLSGWWAALFWAVPFTLGYVGVPRGITTIVTQVAAVLIGLIPGTRGPNAYGGDPRGGGGSPLPETLPRS